MRAAIAMGMIVLGLAACGVHGARVARPDIGPLTDAPYALEDDVDLDEQIDLMWAMPTGDARAALRARLAAALVARAVGLTDGGHWHRAHDVLLDLAGLWQGDAAQLGAGLRPHRAALGHIAETFRGAGADAEVVTALVLVHEAEGGDRTAGRAELDEVLAFLDELGISEHGEIGRHARTLPALRPLVERAAPTWLVDLYIERALARQRLVGDQLAKDGASFALVSAHRDVLATAHAIAGALARAGRVEDIGAILGSVHGIGEDAALAQRAAAVIGARGDARDWVQLARALRGGDDGDPAAALAVCALGLVRFPDDVTLLVAAADHAAAQRRVQQPIALLERARGRAPGDAELAARLADLYRERIIQLAYGGRPLATRGHLAALDRYYADLIARFGVDRWRASQGKALAAAGRALVSQGMLDDATALLERSTRLAPSTDAYEMLAIIALKHERWDVARDALIDGLRLPSTTPNARYARAKLLRLAGDTALGTGDRPSARKLWLASLSLWADLGDQLELPPNLAGERLVESGRALWQLGDPARAIELLETAVDVDRDGGETYVQVVAFLVLQGRLTEALDTVHRGLGSEKVGDYHKVYMSLWMLAEARRRGVAPDAVALDFLRSRRGALWYDRLAQAATGRARLAALRPAANTRVRRAELAFYTAVLGLGDPSPTRAQRRALLDTVIASDMVLFFEYDLARHWSRTWLDDDHG